MDVSDYLKLELPGFYKSQGPTFGKRNTVEQKSKNLKDQRKNTRNQLMSKKRQINDNISPYMTPKPAKNVLTENKLQVNKRLEMLKKWKEEKLRKQSELKAKAKPLFKVSHVSTNMGLPDLSNINKVIKGKPFKTENKIKSKSSTMYEFAPKSHQFKGPCIIAPVDIKVNNQKDRKSKKVTINDETEFITPKKQLKTYKKTPAKVTSTKQQNTNKSASKENVQMNQNMKEYDLRSRRIAVSNNIMKKVGKNIKTTVEKPNLTLKNNKIIDSTVNSGLGKDNEVKLGHIEEQGDGKAWGCNTSISVEYPIGEVIDSSENESTNEKTPQNEHKHVVYISPFVTINRGKNSARKEFHSRKSKGGLYDSSPDIENSTGPKAGAAYFHRLLNSEISRIKELCNQWNTYKEEQKPPEEACDLISVAIGQSHLLIQNKFEHFRKLIIACESGVSNMSITCEDLHGYWDAVYIQVENLNLRFENLTKMQSNNWEEVIPQKKQTNTKKIVPTKKNVQASSSLRDAIKAARDKAKEKLKPNLEAVNTQTNEFNVSFSSITSPSLSSKSPNRSSTKKRKSLRVDVLANQIHKRNSSPGLGILKATQIAKALEEECRNTPSILKTRSSKSDARKVKSVLFKDECVDNVPVGNLISLTDSQEGKNTPSTLKTRSSKSDARKVKSVLFKNDCVDNVPVGNLISLTDSEEGTPRKSLRRRFTQQKLF